MTSPTQRSLAKLRKDGWTCGVVERWNMHARIRQDFAGGIDLIAFRGDTRAVLIGVNQFNEPVREEAVITAKMWGILGVQCCAGSGLAAHRTKLLNEPRMREWVAAGGRLVIHAWRTLSVVKKDGKKGKARRWECNEVELRLDDFPTDPAPAPSAASPEAR